MREFKFRAWNGKQMDYDYRDACLWNGILVAEGDTILMQFTGLTDRSGKEIYEGDILRIPGNLVDYGTHNAVVEWSEQRLGWITSSGLRMTHYYDTPSELEIIGNIYENPELLNQA